MLKIVGIAQKHNAAAKFPGSGGAVVGMCRGDHGRKNLAQLRKEYEEEVRATLLPLQLRLRLGLRLGMLPLPHLTKHTVLSMRLLS